MSLSRYKIIPLLILVSSLSFTVRLGEVFSGLSDSMSGSAFAQHSIEINTEKASSDSLGHDDADYSADHADDSVGKTDAEEHGEELSGWRDASEERYDNEMNLKLFEDLSARRQLLEKHEKELVTREALLKAAEQELDQKYRELEILRRELETLLKKQSDEEKARIQSLVKIYEGMKSGDAARIFNSLDIDVLVEVMSRMSERKLSPILASMNPDRAQAITILLAEEKQLPELSN